MNKKLNKKLLKTIISVATGISVSLSIPFATTSCGCSSEDDVIPPNALPYEVYEIDQSNVLLGFKAGIDLSQYDGICDTMQIPSKVTSVADRAFSFYNQATYKYYTTIPSFITNLTFAKRSNCTSIGQAAFYLSPLTTIKLNNTLETIGIDAFADSLKLASVDFPSSLQSIGESAFVRDYELTSISFPEDNNGKYGLATNLGDNAQVVVEKESDGNYKWTNTSKANGSLAYGDVIIPEGITSIGDMGFWECCSLTSITFPSRLNTIGRFAFVFCSSLNEIVWKNLNITPTIGNSSFMDVANTGHVKSTGNYTSSQLLSLLKEKGELPSSWGVAKIN